MKITLFLLYVIFHFNIVKTELNITLPPSESLQPIHKCLFDVMDQFFGNFTSLTVIGKKDQLNFIADLNVTMVISNNFKRKMTSFNELHVVLFIDEYNDGMLKSLSRTSATKFIIVTNFHTINDIFESFWAIRVLFVLVLVPNEDEIDIYTYSPFHNQNCDELWKPMLINKWDVKLQNFTQISTILRAKDIRINLMGCKFNASFLDLPPFIIRDKSKKVVDKLMGFEGNLIETIAAKLNFTPNYINRHEKNYGGFKPGTVGLLSDLYFGQSIIGFGVLHPYPERYEHLDGATVYNFAESAVFITPRGAGKQIPKWVTLYYTEFTLQMWMWLGLSMILTAFVLKFLKWTAFTIYGHNLAGNVFMIIFSTIVGQSPKVKTVWSLRIYMLWLILFGYVISTAYQSAMSSLLTAPNLPPEIKSIKDLAESDVHFKPSHHGLRFLRSLIEEVDPDTAKEIKKLISNAKVATEKITDMVLNTVRHRNVSYMAHHAVFKYSSGLIKEAIGKINFVKDEIILVHYPAVLLQKHSCFTGGVNKIISRVNSAGLIEKWVGDIFKKYQEIQEAPARKISIDDIYVLFIILGVGWTLSFIVLAVEFINHKLPSISVSSFGSVFVVEFKRI